MCANYMDYEIIVVYCLYLVYDYIISPHFPLKSDWDTSVIKQYQEKD